MKPDHKPETGVSISKRNVYEVIELHIRLFSKYTEAVIQSSLSLDLSERT